MMKDFKTGVYFVFVGIGEFFQHRILWKYVVIPFLFTLALYTLLFYWTLGVFLPEFLSGMENIFAGHWFEFLYTTCKVLIITTYLILLALTAFFAANVFEISGNWFFARMVRCYQREVLKEKVEKLTWQREWRNFNDCVLFSTGTLLLYMFLIVLSFFLPVLGPIITIPLIGFRYAKTYCSEAIFNRGLLLRNTKFFFKERNGLLFGFGSTVFLLFLIPFSVMFLIPGFVIGGTMLCHHLEEN